LIYFGKEICDFQLCCWRFIPQKFKLNILRIFKLASQRKVKTFCCRTSHYTEGSEGVALESEGVEVLRGLKSFVTEVQNDSWWRDWK
jgi:hypothetical protein